MPPKALSRFAERGAGWRKVTCGCEQGRLVISACYNREDAIHGTHCGIRTPKAEAKPKLESEADEEREHEGGEEMCLGDSEKEIQAGRSRILAQSTLDGSCRRLDDAANDGPPRRIAAWGLLPIWTNESPLTAGRPPRRK